VSWAESVDRAYWWTEILDSYCRILMLAKQIGRVERISVPKVEELLDLKERFGMGVDPRRLENADMCINTEFGRGFGAAPHACGCQSKHEHAPATASNGQNDIERVVKEITDRIMATL
jgi:L-fuculose-phosphate aldolase